MFFMFATLIRYREETTARGLEPLRAEPNGFRVHLLSHSDTLSLVMQRFEAGQEYRRKCISQESSPGRVDSGDILYH